MHTSIHKPEETTVQLMASAVYDLLVNQTVDESVSSDALTRQGFSAEDVSIYGPAALELASRKIKGDA